MPKKAAGSRGQTLLASIMALIMLCPLGYYLVRGVITQGGEPAKAFLERPDAKYDSCVSKGTEYMRLHHWELLREIREEVVRYGRVGNVGLNGCRECHTSRERFCDKCHNAVNLKPDCFGCHYYP